MYYKGVWYKFTSFQVEKWCIPIDFWDSLESWSSTLRLKYSHTLRCGTRKLFFGKLVLTTVIGVGVGSGANPWRLP